MENLTLQVEPTQMNAVVGMSLRCKIEAQIAAISEQFDASQRRTKLDTKRLPALCFIQSRTHSPDGVAQEFDTRHAGENAAFPEEKFRMKVADDGGRDLI